MRSRFDARALVLIVGVIVIVIALLWFVGVFEGPPRTLTGVSPAP